MAPDKSDGFEIYMAHDQQKTQIEFKRGGYMPIWAGVS